jgi:hypothetical protein
MKHQSFCCCKRRTVSNLVIKFRPFDFPNADLYYIFVLLLSSGCVSAGLEKVLKIAEFIADIYQQLPRCCIFIINSEAQQQGEN